MSTATNSRPPAACSTGASGTTAEDQAIAPTLLAQLTDLHVEVGPGDAGAARAVAAAVSAVGALRPAPHAVVVTGDVAESGAGREYERARELLAPLPMPVYALPGNHDDADTLSTYFGAPGAHGYSVPVGGIRLVAMDSTLPGLDEGSLSADRLAWLEAELAADIQTPTVVAMHHPPVLTGIPALDLMGLPEDDRRGLAEVLAANPHVRRVVAGHVHRTVFGALGSCGVMACPATFLEARLEIGGTILDLVHASPSYALHVAFSDECTSHVQAVTTAA
jgi:3',5'-cyclic-AMP phosphodiesterase